MAKLDKSLEPQQARSRESLRRLLKASVEVLGQNGVAGTTIPRIAAHAGLTPGAIYRRFANKDVLLETAILQILEDQDRTIRQSLTLEMAAKIPLAVLAAQLINGLVLSYRANAGVLRAIRQFVQGREQTVFGKKAMRLERRSVEYLIDLLAAGAPEMEHPEPRAAVAFAVLMIAGTLWEYVVNTPDIKFWKGLLPQDDAALMRELTRAFLSYLGRDPDAG